MDVRLPDGKVIKNVPDGMTKADLVAKLKANGHDVSGLETPQAQEINQPQIKPFNTELTFPEKAAMWADKQSRNLFGDFGKDTFNKIDSHFGKGSELDGLVQGAAEPIVGIAQLGADAVGLGDKVNPAIQAQNSGYEQAREQEGRDGFDWARLAGNIASPVNVPTSGGQAFKQGAGIGALYGAENPVNDIPQDGSYWGEKAKQVAIGASTGGVTSAALTGIANQLKNQGLAKSLMQSALKPTVQQQKSGEADKAIATFLKERLNPTRGGVDELESRIGNINDDVASIIASSNKSVDKQSVINRLKDTVDKFATQVSPSGDLNAIKGIADDFIDHPSIQGAAIPVQQAQALKQGTYRVLKGKFGETGSAATEAQKALARGLKEEVGAQHPEILPMLSRESDLINALNVGERRALMDGNKNPVSLGASIAMSANNPIATAGLIANSSALAKSLAARGVNRVTTLNNHPELAQKLAELLRKSAPYAGAPAAYPMLNSGN
jgi:hypothetical protein